MADETENPYNFLFSSDYDRRLQEIELAKQKVARADAGVRNIPTRIKQVIKDKAGKPTEVVDVDVSQSTRRAMAQEQRQDMIARSKGRDQIKAAEAIPPDYNETSIALYGLGVDERDIAKLMNLAEQGDVAGLVGTAGRVGEVLFEKRLLPGMSKLALGPEQVATKDVIRQKIFSTLSTLHERAQQMARNTGKPTSAFGEMAISQEDALQGGLSLSNEGGISPEVAKSAGRDGTRAFTNIGAGGKIQEIAPESQLLRVIRKADQTPGYIRPDLFDPAKYEQADMGIEEAQADPNFSTNAQVAAVPQPTSLIPPMSPAERIAKMQGAAPMSLPSLPSLGSMFPMPARKPLVMPPGTMPNPSFPPLTPYGF